MQTLQGVGWQWRTDGVVVTLQVDGRRLQVLVPLRNVWTEFAKSFQAAGVPMPAAVSGPIEVSGLFSSIAHAASGIAHAVTHNVITKAAGSVVHAATSVALHNPLANLAGKAISAVPVVGPLANSVASLVSTPLAVADQLAQGGRLDKVAMNALKTSLANVKQIAPYAQIVLSAVPGVGTGLNAAIGAGLALASGQNISDALVAGVRNMLPGGPLAAAAFDVAHAAMQGKPITAIALNALPIAPAQKQALVQGISLAKDLASGKKVSQALIDTATHALPPDLQKAVQVGAALAHAKSLQGAVGTLAQAATLSSTVASGLNAAQHVQQLVSAGQPVPPSLQAALKAGLQARQVIDAHAAAAAQGHPTGVALLNALRFHSLVQPPTPRVSGPLGHKAFKARYHTGHKAAGKPGGGIHKRFAVGCAVSGPQGQHKHFKARYHTHPRGNHPQSHVGAPWPRHMAFARMQAIPPQVLRRAWRP